MPVLRSVDIEREAFVIGGDMRVSTREQRPGPPERAPGMTVGIIEMQTSAPHGGEIHPDGDEVLVVLSGRVRVIAEAEPDAPVELGPGDACIVAKGEWHRVEVVEPVRLLHMTPGPDGDHRPLAE